MKKLLALLLVLTMLLAFASCRKKKDPGKPEKTSSAEPASEGETTDPADSSVPDVSAEPVSAEPSSEEETTLPVNIPTGAQTSMRETFNQIEYSLYISIFYDKTGDKYVGDAVEKEGVFSVIRDEFNKKDRYYVWGYLDKTRCCDYQWEIVPNDIASLPSPGSYIRVNGTFAYNKAALDKYWIENADVTLIEAYKGPDYDFDCLTMSPTLARVEIANMLNFPASFDGKTVQLFGRAYNSNCLQHPYYDNSWVLDFVSDEKPATGMYLILGGVFTAEGNGGYVKVNSYKLAV